MCRIGELVIAPWHPIWLGEKWIFPNWVADSTVLYTGGIYEKVLESLMCLLVTNGVFESEKVKGIVSFLAALRNVSC
jgi:hypothetical protein